MPGAARRRVLVIDDNASIRELVAELLQLEGYDVAVAAEGEAGLRLLATLERPCLILLDLEMPGMGGAAFLERLGAETDRDRLPVLLMTGRDVAIPPGVVGTLRKPMDVDELIRRVATHSPGV